MLRTIISIWRDFSSQMKKQNISAYASSTAFFLFLSVIPMLMVVCAVIPYTPVTEQNLITALTDDAGYCGCHGGESGRGCV